MSGIPMTFFPDIVIGIRSALNLRHLFTTALSNTFICSVYALYGRNKALGLFLATYLLAELGVALWLYTTPSLHSMFLEPADRYCIVDVPFCSLQLLYSQVPLTLTMSLLCTVSMSQLRFSQKTNERQIASLTPPRACGCLMFIDIPLIKLNKCHTGRIGNQQHINSCKVATTRSHLYLLHIKHSRELLVPNLATTGV